MKSIGQRRPFLSIEKWRVITSAVLTVLCFFAYYFRLFEEPVEVSFLLIFTWPILILFVFVYIVAEFLFFPEGGVHNFEMSSQFSSKELTFYVVICVISFVYFYAMFWPAFAYQNVRGKILGVIVTALLFGVIGILFFARFKSFID